MFACQAQGFVNLNVFLFAFLLKLSVCTIGTSIEFPPDNDELITTIEVLEVDDPNALNYGANVTIICKTKILSSSMWWTFNENNVSRDDGYIVDRESENINKELAQKQEVSFLHILGVSLKHVGNYKCHAMNKTEIDFDQIVLNVTLAPQISMSEIVRTKIHVNVKLHCLVLGYPITGINWFKDKSALEAEAYKIKFVNETYAESLLEVSSVTKKDNGTYTCKAQTPFTSKQNETAILVLDKPVLKLDFVKSIGKSKIYINWTMDDGNEPNSIRYSIRYKEDGNENWVYYQQEIKAEYREHILEDVTLKPNATYTLRMEAINSEGSSPFSDSKPIRILTEDPVFTPEVKVTGVTVSSITISWTDPSRDLGEYVQFFKLKSRPDNMTSISEAVSHLPSKNLYMFNNLDPATTYNFQVCACCEYCNTCGPWSLEVNGTTMDGMAGPVTNASVECKYENVTQMSFVYVSWKPPLKRHGTVVTYNVTLEGNASFINDRGILELTTWRPKARSINENTLNTRFYNVSANTNYTVTVSAVTKSKKSGDKVELFCTMPPTIPDKQRLSRFNWRKMEEQGRWVFKLFMPRISERNGPICCYRIYLVRMEAHQKLAELPSPDELEIVSYNEAHRTPKGGAYVAEMFTSSNFHPEVFLGDDDVYNFTSSLCDKCIGLRPYTLRKKDRNSYSNNTTVNRTRRFTNSLPQPLPPHDGLLDINSNYTGFVEIIVGGAHLGTEEVTAVYSNYLMILNPGPDVITAPVSGSVGIVVQILCGLLVVALLLATALCLLHQYTKQAHAQAVEMITFRTSLRNLRGRQRLVSLNPPDMCPIGSDELVSAYMERHRDSDYGFQQEFELLPDRFSDRTTRASDARENVYKNRYPDIKAYDQTRVKLFQVDGIAGSDYINANIVLGYKERKKFICAQGPMDTTVDEFWRLIWEQHLEMILMLTNLEEYSKTKCAKYWPDRSEVDKVFGDISVTHVQETRYSDYIVRELKITRGGLKDSEERKITQYHYLVWKDFMAPEHPHGIIKFIKRMNEAYSPEKGPILIHCSAGVGRTGTLVALDCLLQQVKEEGQVTIFNTICDLRHQRNFLVQSLKQYIFIYRALMEVVQYGDTEMTASDLKSSIEKLKKVDRSRSKMEDEFENIKNTMEDRKSCSVASGDENREKNRSDTVIPYDRNRVILTPLAGREHSTYINASFIEGYDNSESFIITQDPVESTVGDFWRMIAEQGIGVIVMLSELGENKCPRYWPETETETVYEHITVRYVRAESCPYYTRREFLVRTREGDDLSVTQLQYHGWPTVDGEVPEVTRGLIELVDYAHSTVSCLSSPSPMAVHCNMGSDRSSIFVGLSILVQQLRIERRVDVFIVARKLRSQRQAMINTFGQYEFLYRAILNYSELHGLCET
nr:tyrosine-protein phosphatase 69D [Onthophagus taurus]